MPKGIFVSRELRKKIAHQQKSRIIQFELHSDGFKGVLFRQFILALLWFAIL